MRRRYVPTAADRQSPLQRDGLPFPPALGAWPPFCTQRTAQAYALQFCVRLRRSRHTTTLTIPVRSAA